MVVLSSIVGYRGGRSDIRSDQVFRYMSIEFVRVFLYVRPVSGIFSSDSVILGRVFGHSDLKKIY